MVDTNTNTQSDLDPFKDQYWYARGSDKLLTYIGPELHGTLDTGRLKQYLKEKKAWAAIWNYDHDYTDDGTWYRCICDTKNYDENCISSKNTRHNLRRSLKRCTVRHIDYPFLAKSGYDIYVKASARYSNFTLETEEQFYNRMISLCDVDGAEAFGVFVKEQLVAYMTLFVRQDSAWGDTAAFNPEYSKAYPMYALYYEVARHYLQERGLKEFDRGTRPLMHETNIDDFLLRLGYRKAYCRLGVYFSRPVTMVLGLARIFKPICRLTLPTRYSSILDGLLLAQNLAKSTSIKSQSSCRS